MYMVKGALPSPCPRDDSLKIRLLIISTCKYDSDQRHS